MPHANVWVRKADWDKWNSIEKKSEFLHNALKGTHTISITEPTVPNPSPSRGLRDMKRTKSDILKDIDEMKAEAQEKLEYCQDPAEAKRITDDYDKVIQGYWNEYKETDS